MSTDQKHLYLVARGDYVGSAVSAERWQFGIRLWADKSVPDNEGLFPTTGDYAPADDSDASDGLHITSNWSWEVLGGAIIDPVTYLHDQAANGVGDFINSDAFSVRARLKELRLYPMQGNGEAFESRVAVCTYDTPVLGTRTGNAMPLELSLVTSWRTTRPGPRGRGRIYPPISSATNLDTDGFANGTAQGDQADAAQAMLEALAIEGALPGDPHLRPVVTGDPWTNYAVIVSLDVGSVFDVQRRRRRSLVETRTSRSPSYG